jgi:hypothetical protein
VTQRAQVSQSQNEQFPQATALKLPFGASLLNSGAKTKTSFRLPPNQIEQRRSAWPPSKNRRDGGDALSAPRTFAAFGTLTVRGLTANSEFVASILDPAAVHDKFLRCTQCAVISSHNQCHRRDIVGLDARANCLGASMRASPSGVRCSRLCLSVISHLKPRQIGAILRVSTTRIKSSNCQERCGRQAAQATAR